MDETATDLKASLEREYKLLFDQVPCSVVIIDRDFKIVRSNKQAKDLFGDLNGQHCYCVLKNLDKRCIECTARRTFEDGREHSGRHTWKLNSGEILFMHVITIPVHNEDGSYDLVMEMAVDITKNVKLQTRLESAHHYLESLVDTSMDAIVGISKKGKVAVFNPAARTMFNIEKGQVVSLEDINAMFPKGFLAEVSSSKGHVYLPETRLKQINGNPFYGRLVGNNLEDPEQSLGMAFLIHDISEVKKLEKENIEAQRMAFIGQTVAGLAHGIKNLINALDGGMYFLKSGIGKSDITRIHKGIETLSRNIERIRSYTKALLNFAKPQKINPILCNPGDIVNEVIESFSSALQKNSIQVEVAVDNMLTSIPLDAEKIHECVTNLISNAIDAFKDIDPEKEKRIRADVYEEEGALYIEIIDNGCGIDSDHQQKIFTKFFTTKGLEGTGLGLLMTQKIVQEHGGNISILSKKGEGSTFRIRFLKGRLPKLL